jgi:hypothetical protein
MAEMKQWPDHDKLLWLMASIHNWDVAPPQILDRALKLWFTAQEMLQTVNFVHNNIDMDSINTPEDLHAAIAGIVKDPV